jgi:RNA polymerase sigma-70 factor (ECF subfamily)
MDSEGSHGQQFDGAGEGGSSALPLMPESSREGIRSRDPEALSELFDCYFGLIYNLAYRLLGEKMAAEDAVQEVFLRAYRSAHQYDPKRDLGPWLTAIAYNVCRDCWRSSEYRMMRGSQSLDAMDGPGEHLLVTDRCPEKEMLDTERDRLLMDGLMKLPEEQRAVVILHDFHGLTHEEIAGILGAAPAAVRKRYSRALGRLLKVLKDDLA